ncbi:MAG: signal recognition particle-docking protein FtsY [Blastochloris sp.]|nr:signal recognition particle-docking protein FtsY [Blastochloris sp.]
MLSIFKKWAATLQGGAVDWDDLEATLIQSDLGLPLTEKILASLKRQAVSAETIQSATAAEILKLWPVPPTAPSLKADRLNVWLVIGINGVGKTTSIGKLAHLYGRENKVHLVAADTFRRRRPWISSRFGHKRASTGFTAGTEGGDPAAAAFQGLEQALKEASSLALIDTAGRLHNKENLMRELEKIKRVIDSRVKGAPHEILLVVDGTNGANAIQQAEVFHQALGLTGLIVTKLDSSSKGGAVAAIKAQTGVSPYFIGTGETLQDLKPFDPQSYVEKFF